MPRVPSGLPWPVLVVLLLAACAPGPGSDAIRAVADTEIARRPDAYNNGEARAWQVRKDGTVRGLLWGTLHVGYGEDTVLPAPIRSRFYAAADLTVETTMDRQPAATRAMLAEARQANAAYDAAAVARLDEPTRQALAAVPGTDGHDLSLRGLTARVVADALHTTPDPAALPDRGIADLSLIAFARQQGRPVHGLERLSIFDPTLADPNGPEAQAALLHALRRRATFPAYNRWLRATYRAGDMAAFNAATAAWQSTPADLARADRNRVPLLTDRNAAWLPRLDRLFSRPGDHFVAVGAAHFSGQDGLVALLRAKGYDVSPCIEDVCR